VFMPGLFHVKQLGFENNGTLYLLRLPHLMFEYITSYPAFCLAVLVFLMVPGPGTLALLSATAQGGVRAGAAATMGVVLGDQLLLWAAVAGISALVAAHPQVWVGLKWVGAAYLVVLGVQIFRAASNPAGRVDSASEQGAAALFSHLRRAFFITVLNPKAILFYIAFFPQFLTTAAAPGGAFGVLAATIVVITLFYGVGLCAVAAHAARALSGAHSWGIWVQRGLGLGMVAFGISLISVGQGPA
jgi:threonine/homoserine/homoserine lactone efflux protein